jgi:hypothetical protein
MPSWSKPTTRAVETVVTILLLVAGVLAIWSGVQYDRAEDNMTLCKQYAIMRKHKHILQSDIDCKIQSYSSGHEPLPKDDPDLDRVANKPCSFWPKRRKDCIIVLSVSCGIIGVILILSLFLWELENVFWQRCFGKADIEAQHNNDLSEIELQDQSTPYQRNDQQDNYQTKLQDTQQSNRTPKSRTAQLVEKSSAKQVHPLRSRPSKEHHSLNRQSIDWKALLSPSINDTKATATNTPPTSALMGNSPSPPNQKREAWPVPNTGPSDTNIRATKAERGRSFTARTTHVLSETPLPEKRISVADVARQLKPTPSDGTLDLAITEYGHRDREAGATLEGLTTLSNQASSVYSSSWPLSDQATRTGKNVEVV